MKFFFFFISMCVSTCMFGYTGVCVGGVVLIHIGDICIQGSTVEV